MRRLALLLVAASSMVACRVDRAPAPVPPASVAPTAATSSASTSRASPSPSPSASSSPSPAAKAKATPNPFCGLGPSDWCPAREGDLCGAHKDTASCRADQKCVGMRYRGESVVACQYDARGFATNCPTVGCVSISR